MHPLRHTQTFKRWLPLMVLLVVLAQLSMAAHWHPDNHSVVDCGLCLQQGGNTAALSSHQLSFASPESPLPLIEEEPARPISAYPYSAPIRAPPVSPQSRA